MYIYVRLDFGMMRIVGHAIYYGEVSDLSGGEI